jgi:hypothetical protein
MPVLAAIRASKTPRLVFDLSLDRAREENPAGRAG